MLSCIWLFATPWIVACHTPLFMGFSRQEYWSGLSCPPPEDLHIPVLNSNLLCHRRNLYPLSHLDGGRWVFDIPSCYNILSKISGFQDFPCSSVVKNLPANARDADSSLVCEGPTCCKAVKPMCHHYWSPSTLEPAFCNYCSLLALELVLCNKRNHSNKKPPHHN